MSRTDANSTGQDDHSVASGVASAASAGGAIDRSGRPRVGLLFGVVSVVGVATAAAFYAMSERPQPASAGGESARPLAATPTVRLGVVERLEQPTRAVYDSVVRSVERAHVAFTQSGRIGHGGTDRLVVGTRVKAGQVLATLVAESARHATRAHEGKVQAHHQRVEQQERDTERARAMAAKGVASAADVERADSQLRMLRESERALRAELNASRWALSEARLSAPFDGTIARVILRNGEFAVAGQPVLELHGNTHEIEVHVPQRLAAALSVGDKLPVTFPGAAAAKATATVRSASTVGVPPSNLCVVVLTLADEDAVHSGQAVRVHAPTTSNSDRPIVIPIEAVVDTFGTRPHVVRVDDNIARVVDVAVGRLAGRRVTVTGDLEAGQQVVTAGHRWVVDGDTVTVVE
jgi:RND family efflux transporter MFP subunit